MKTSLRIPEQLLRTIRADLSRPHPFAGERVGFIACRAASLANDGLLLLGSCYLPVADEHYVNEPTVGAMMGSSAIRAALQYAYSEASCMFHVHQHEHMGLPRFSPVDLKGYAAFVPNFWHVRPNLPHGALVLSHNAATGLCWHPNTKQALPVNSISVVGLHTQEIGGHKS